MTNPRCREVANYEFHEVKEAKRLGPLLTRLSESGFEVTINAPHESGKEDEDEEPHRLKQTGPWLVSAKRCECRCLCSSCGKPVKPEEASK